MSAAGQRRSFLCSISRGEGRRHLVDGLAASPESAALRPALAVFMPDRLALVKGPPAGRRAHLDGFCAALWPGRAETRRRYSRALAQRNALLGRIRAGARRPGVARRLGPGALRGGRGPDRRPSRGGGRCSHRRSNERRSASASPASPRFATGREPRRPTRQSSPPSSASAATPTSPAATAAGAPTSTSSRSSRRLARCAATDRRASSAPPCSPCSSPSAGLCSTTAARRR